MNKNKKMYIMLFSLLLVISGVYADSQLVASIVINTAPKAKPSDTAIFYGVVTNEGSLYANFSLSLEHSDLVVSSVSPKVLYNVAPGQQFIVKITLSSDYEGTYNVTLIINQTHIEKTANVSLSNVLMINIIFLVSPNVETTKENPPSISIGEQPEEERPEFSYWVIAMIVFLVIVVIVVFVPLYKYWERIKKKI